MTKFFVGLLMVAAGLLLWIVAIKIGADLGTFLSKALAQ